MWVCEAWQVNIWTVFAVRPNGPNNNNKNNNNFASSRSDHLGSDNQSILLNESFGFRTYILMPVCGKWLQGSRCPAYSTQTQASNCLFNSRHWRPQPHSYLLHWGGWRFVFSRRKCFSLRFVYDIQPAIWWLSNIYNMYFSFSVHCNVLVDLFEPMRWFKQVH